MTKRELGLDRQTFAAETSVRDRVLAQLDRTADPLFTFACSRARNVLLNSPEIDLSMSRSVYTAICWSLYWSCPYHSHARGAGSVTPSVFQPQQRCSSKKLLVTCGHCLSCVRESCACAAATQLATTAVRLCLLAVPASLAVAVKAKRQRHSPSADGLKIVEASS